MKARNIMTAPVTSVAPDTRVREIAAILLAQRISGVPVVSNDRVVGMVSEGDLLHRHENGTDHSDDHRSWWARLIKDDPLPAEYVKSHGRQASDVMTRHVVSVLESTPVIQIASIFEARSIKRVPVLRDRSLVGIVCRADLVRSLILQTEEARPCGEPTDEAIRHQLLAELRRQPWWRSGWSTVYVTGGVVRYRGMLENESERTAARVAAENVPGVRGVEDNRTLMADWHPMG